ncbi:hypothetical protein MTO96_028682 [Rhipicephalus appendiculatus]
MPTCERPLARRRHCDRVRDRAPGRDCGSPARVTAFLGDVFRPNRLHRRLRPVTVRARRGEQRAGSSPGLVLGQQHSPASRTRRASPRQPANNDFTREHKCTEVAIIPNFEWTLFIPGPPADLQKGRLY